MSGNRKDKERLRSLKREIKRSGNKKVRSRIKHDLATNPEEAHLTQVDYDGHESKKLNGMDYDSTRKKKTRRQLYDEQNGGIMAQEGPNDEELSIVRDREQDGSEGVSELCPPLLGGESAEEGTEGKV